MELFEEYGKVDSVKMLRGVGENTPIIGMVSMVSEIGAERAIEALQGEVLLGHAIKIEPSFEHIHVHHGADYKPTPIEEDDEEEDDEGEEETPTDYEPSEEPDWEV